MTNRECLKGWILAPSPTDGQNVPFFVQVRDKDIVWDIKNISKELNELSLLGSSREVFYPACQWKFKINKWDVTLKQDATYTATRKIRVAEIFDYINESTLLGNTDLPFETMNDTYLSVQCTIMSSDNDIETSVISVSPIEDELVKTIDLKLRNNGVIYSNEFKTSGEYSNSYVYITVTGKLKI